MYKKIKIVYQKYVGYPKYLLIENTAWSSVHNVQQKIRSLTLPIAHLELLCKVFK